MPWQVLPSDLLKSEVHGSKRQLKSLIALLGYCLFILLILFSVYVHGKRYLEEVHLGRFIFFGDFSQGVRFIEADLQGELKLDGSHICLNNDSLHQEEGGGEG